MATFKCQMDTLLSQAMSSSGPGSRGSAPTTRNAITASTHPSPKSECECILIVWAAGGDLLMIIQSTFLHYFSSFSHDPDIFFSFITLLLISAALESLGLIFTFGQDVQSAMSNNTFIMLLGAGSAVIDNVPLVAASMGMFDVSQYGTDSSIWHFIAYAAGTGGSMLIIGSAAGVVAMGMEKISFFWYLKNISWLALIGYLAGAGVFLLM